ncbi:hypothetical protein ABID47_005208 [Paenibacillus favisporus]|uniref:Uncharacterized protein n=1 Tax=Paenibacillus favisporus TaxID=221028 RepID=A0ABV2F9X8_9BACL
MKVIGWLVREKAHRGSLVYTAGKKPGRIYQSTL